MNTISTEIFDFLSDIKKNNNREWFASNKSRYEKSRQEFILFVEKLIQELTKFDQEVKNIDPKKAVFRIYKDTRFSKDKTPYKTNFGAHIVAHGSKPHDRAGYYIHLEPGNTFLAGGAYLPPGPWIKAIREELDYDAESFRKILNNKEFKKYFGKIEGEQLKTAPKGYPKDHPEIDLLRYKSFLAVHKLSDKDVHQQDFLKHCVTVFKAIQPFDQFLNRVLA